MTSPALLTKEQVEADLDWLANASRLAGNDRSLGLREHIAALEQRVEAATELWASARDYHDSLRATVSITWVEAMDAALPKEPQ